ncbi:acetylornithine aminotransferase [Chloropicon primus]|uniref:acetylornithine transaminase n=1 Tax=Chloropicon primus TaxID=1764295 RepID=A0A5B8MET7_9CHLO|nr:acetylornithine aminotransferase [Chloropicon primus]UPQ98115.1 acetylornithine aminotransferase [Chloropicon primus]|eukprot:QDZ18907.1 acetylornithine aminotransferase [Chloropicon primus]
MTLYKFEYGCRVRVGFRAQVARSASRPSARRKALGCKASTTSAGSMPSVEVQELETEYLLGTYAGARPAGVSFVRGDGCRLFDAEGREYLDFTSGIAVNCLGHSDKELTDVLSDQLRTLVHVSNLYSTEPAALLARELCKASSPWAQKAFFVNSGTEANEAAIKFARKYQKLNGKGSPSLLGRKQQPTEFVAFSAGFHGRTMGALALTSKAKYRTPFEPVMPGVKFAEYNNLKSAAKVIRRGRTCAVFVEPFQGEGGCNPSTRDFLVGLRKLCDDAGALLVYDEVQCGLGRTGKMFAHQWYGEGACPDIMTLAKPLAAGLPIGAVLMTNEIAEAISLGDHGSTFAGGPFVCTSGLHVMSRLQEGGFLQEVSDKGDYLVGKLSEAVGGKSFVREVRGKGLIVGIEIDRSAGPIVAKARDRGLLVITAGEGNVVRLVPPLVVERGDIDRCVEVLKECFEEVGAAEA